MKVFLYTLNTLADWEIGYITAELTSRRCFNTTQAPTGLIKVGDTTQPITTMGGMTITPDQSIDDIVFNDSDILILPGADTWLEGNHKRTISLIPKLLNQNVTVAAICGATVALAESGVLNDKRHTSNDKAFLKMSCPDYSGEALYLNQPVVTDGNLITATGLAPLEFACEVFKKTNAMEPETIEAWYQLNSTKDAKYFYTLMESLK